jgi:hypothetical protein
MSVTFGFLDSVHCISNRMQQFRNWNFSILRCKMEPVPQTLFALFKISDNRQKPETKKWVM